MQKTVSPEFQEFLDSPYNKEGAIWGVLPTVLRKYSPYQMQITVEQYKSLIDGNISWEMAGLALNVLIAQTAHSMEMEMNEYLEFHQQVADAAKAWNETVVAKRLELDPQTQNTNTVPLPTA